MALDDFSFRGVYFSPRLRPDLLQLDSFQTLYRCATQATPCPRGEVLSQAHPIDTHFDDGGPNGDRLVSPLVPAGIPTGPLDPADPRGAHKFPTAPVIWTKAGEARLSFEVVAVNPRISNGPLTYSSEPFTPGRSGDSYEDGGNPVSQFVINPFALMGPATFRNVVILDGDVPIHRDLFAGGFHPSLPGYAAFLETCSGSSVPETFAGPPQRLDANCTRRKVDASLCSGGTHGNSFLPYTALNCRFPVQRDGGFRLRFAAERADVPGVEQKAPPQMPDVRVVNGTRILFRAVRFDREECRMPGPGGVGEEPCTEAVQAEVNLWRRCVSRRSVEAPDERVSLRDCPIDLSFPGAGEMSDLTRIQSHWVFSAADATGKFQEHFSPELRLTQMIPFVIKPGGETRTFRPEEIGQLQLRHPAFGSVAAGADIVTCSPTPDPSTGEAVFELSRCGNRTVNPTPAFPQGTADYNVAMTWRLIFEVTAVPELLRRVMVRQNGTITWQEKLLTNVIVEDLAVRKYDEVFFMFVLTDQRAN